MNNFTIYNAQTCLSIEPFSPIQQKCLRWRPSYRQEHTERRLHRLYLGSSSLSIIMEWTLYIQDHMDFSRKKIPENQSLKLRAIKLLYSRALEQTWDEKIRKKILPYGDIRQNLVRELTSRCQGNNHKETLCNLQVADFCCLQATKHQSYLVTCYSIASKTPLIFKRIAYIIYTMSID